MKRSELDAKPDSARDRHAGLVASVCPLDCPDTCSLELRVEHGRVLSIEGSHANPLTAGFICEKVRGYARHLEAPERVLHPLRRIGPKGSGRFERIGWDEALDELCARVRATLARSGGEAILPVSYGGSNGFLSQGNVDARLFERLGASRLLHTVCAAPSGAAAQGLYGRMCGVALDDYEHARLIVLWGVNPKVTGIHLLPPIQRARRAGAQLVVIDPLRTELARRSDLHLAPLPGTDLPLALAVAHLLAQRGQVAHAFLAQHAQGAQTFLARAAEWPLERAARVCGLAPAAIEGLAALYAAASPALIRCGWGLERNRNGGSAIAAVLALPAIAGKFGVRGGGYTMSNSAEWKRALGSARAESSARAINMNQLGRALLEERDPALELLFVYNTNPLATYPDQERLRRGLAREDLYVAVHEQVLTDSARMADLVLPATSFLEHDELRAGYGALALLRARPALAPMGEAWPNWKLFAELERRLGLARPGEAREPAELCAEIYARAGLTAAQREQLELGEALAPPVGEHPVQFVDAWPHTPDRRVQLVPPELERAAPGGLYCWRPNPHEADGSLTLISPASPRRISSSLGELEREPASVRLHPDEAHARGIAHGAAVRVHNRLGEVHCLAACDADVRLGVAVLEKGLWAHSTANGATANALVPDSLSDLGGGACFNDARVEIEPCETAAAE
jgi:anaerobic selenocysteine-containing dehydrogenase